MGLGASIFMVAVGAILTYGITADVSGVSLDTIGIILMIVGAAGAVLSMLFWSSFAPFGNGSQHVERETTTDGDGHVVETTRTTRSSQV